MIAVAELRLGNLVKWIPSLAHPASTLSPQVVEVAAVLPASIGYVPANIANRVEPFQDDLLQQEPTFKDATEFEAILLQPALKEAFNKQVLAEEHALHLNIEHITFLHQYQNLYYLLTGEELDTSYLHHFLNEF